MEQLLNEREIQIGFGRRGAFTYRGDWAAVTVAQVVVGAASGVLAGIGAYEGRVGERKTEEGQGGTGEGQGSRENMVGTLPPLAGTEVLGRLGGG